MALTSVLAAGLVACMTQGDRTTGVVSGAPARSSKIAVSAPLTDGSGGSGPMTSALSKAKGVQLTAGTQHGCVLRSDGTVACWGTNDAGQFGRPAFARAVSAVPAPGFDGVTELAAGARHTCARRSSGDVICVGDDSHGQLGSGRESSGAAAGVQPVHGLADVTAIAAGAHHTCALREGGRISCWGRADRGQIGDGSGPEVKVARQPRDVAGLADAVEVRASGDRTCARRRSGGVTCWGSSSPADRTGKGDARSPVDVREVPDAIAIGVGPSHACAVRDKVGSVVCWGDDSASQLGGAGTQPQRTVVETRSLGGDPLDLALSERATCARLVTGEAVCWGEGARAPRVVTRGIRQIAAGRSHFCALKTKGNVVCWGDNSGGQLGEGFTSVPRTDPVTVQGLYDGD